MNALLGMAQIKQEIHNRFIEANVSIPPIPMLMVQWFLLFLPSAAELARTRNEQQLQTFAVATALVQMGLNAHEQINPNVYTYSVDKIPQMQVTVLQGDYYSSKFYALLANQSDFRGISLLCEAIMQVNRDKVAIWNEQLSQQPLQLSTYQAARVRMRLGIFDWFAKLMPTELRQLYQDGLSWIAITEWLDDEMRALSQGRSLMQEWLGNVRSTDDVWEEPTILQRREHTLVAFENRHNHSNWTVLRSWIAEDLK